MNILLLGSGGRESALAWKMAQSSHCDKLYIAPGNGGTPAYGENVTLNPMDFDAVRAFVEANAVDMIVVGSEDPLVAGIYDYFASDPVLVLGPSREGARLEGSKEFAKQFMSRHGIPTAAYRSFTARSVEQGCDFLRQLAPPYVLKADGLAAGKGVLIVDDYDEACSELRAMLGGKFGASSATVVVEEFLSGIECSVFVLTDGNGGYRMLPVAKDYKRAGEGDTGLNTGGMGAVSPVPFADDYFMAKVEERIVRPTIEGIKSEGITYRGFIFFGLINCNGDPKVIEYNVRMGDPETEVVMLRVHTDLLPLLIAAAQGDLGDKQLAIDPPAAATVIMTAGGYPESYRKGDVIEGIEDVTESIVFQAGTRIDADGRTLTAGGRVLAVSSYGATIGQALATSYRSAELIKWAGEYHRRDIGRDLLGL